VVFGLVLLLQLVLVAWIGTDVPFQDQWDVEGRRLYPEYREGTWQMSELWRPHNEHRIVWTKLLDLALFSANGQWDPLVQLTADALIRAATAALLAAMLARGIGTAGRWLVGGGLLLMFLPHVAWTNALWAFQSQVYFVMFFSLVTLALLGNPERTPGQLAAGLLAGIAALLAMGAGVFTPAALLGLALVRAMERRKFDASLVRETWPALVLLAAAWCLRGDGRGTDMLRAVTPGQFFNAWERALAWPHTAMPLAAFGMNVPLIIAVGGRLTGWRKPAAGEDYVVLIAAWSVIAAAGLAWARGGGHELEFGVTSRYVDFLLLLPIANAWLAVALARQVASSRQRLAQTIAVAWGLFLLVGWLGLSAEVFRGFILPRLRDPDYPVRLAVEFQRTGDAAVFVGQPLYYHPHPNPEVVKAVLNDPRMKGALPPSFQPERLLGPLSRVVRSLLRRHGSSP